MFGGTGETVGARQLHRTSDALVKHREAIETHLFDRALGLFDLQPTVTLYDLTNTYFEGAGAGIEGEAQGQPAAAPGADARRQRLRPPLATVRRPCGAGSAVPVRTQVQRTVPLRKVIAPDSPEVRLDCCSSARAQQERSLGERRAQIRQRRGRWQARPSRVAAQDRIAGGTAGVGQQAVAVPGTRRPQDSSPATHPGVHGLRSSATA